MGSLLFLLKYMYISLLLKMIYGFSWPAKIIASPFKQFIHCVRFDKNERAKNVTFGCSLDNFIIILGCLVHVLVVLGKQTTDILNTAHQS